MKSPKHLPNFNESSRVVSQKNSAVEIPSSLLKLSVVTQFYPPDFAATGQLIEELVHQLGRQGVDIKVFTGQPAYAFQSAKAPGYERAGLVQVKRSRSTQVGTKRIRGKAVSGVLFMVRTALHLIKNCRRRDLLLVTTAPPFLPVLGYLASWLLGFPYVCLLYDLYPDIAVELGVVAQEHWMARFWRSVNRLVWRKAEAVIVLSPDMRQRVLEHCPDLTEKVFVIHSWADPKRITPRSKQDNWFAQQNDLVDQFTVLYSGNLGRCHDMDTILDAAIQLQNAPIQFVFIGNGAKREILQREIQRLGLTNIRFLPYQDKDVLPYSLTAGDLSLVSVIPGMENLVAPSKLYSALASGKPIAVVCPQQCYLRSLIQKAGCGKVFQNGDSNGLAAFIRQLSQDQQRTEQLGQAGRQYMETHFTPEIIARQYYNVLHWALEPERSVVPDEELEVVPEIVSARRI
ncbi:glycosyltransferase family 4 protein [Egbenema bharatensis]|uniref:glycosyltransferase family 4 protein n=1 Tax=Egbenema bharatensis TaxID=3463334 RepID=UPI003A884704